MGNEKMHIEPKIDKTIEYLLKLKEGKILEVNPEYQRGLTWKPYQQQFFIDSIFRKYPIPAFYLHKETVEVDEDMGSVTLWIVDGQQRINAINDFVKGAFPLLSLDDFKFPNFLKDEESPWAGKRFEELTKEQRDDFLSTKVVTYTITTEDKDRIRDLFIRLQGGVALTPQDRRDSWPGEFTKFILIAGGKPKNPEWYGWDFFKEIPQIPNESRRRTFAAQCYMLFQKNRDKEKFIDINSPTIDDYYYANVNFDSKPNHKDRFKIVCDRLYEIFKNEPKRISMHFVIHLILFMDSILDKAVSSDFERIPEALHTFKVRVKDAKDAFKKDIQDFEHRDYFHHYGHYTGTSSDSFSSIQNRHAFFVKEMEKLVDITYKDPKRTLSILRKESVFYRDNRKCQICRMKGIDATVDGFSDAEFHHIDPHAEGGKTSVDNNVTVHKGCHPKSSEEVAKFRNWWNDNKI